ncbi:MAG: hypothetical protein AB4290_09950 [Spirulina sp.]
MFCPPLNHNDRIFPSILTIQPATAIAFSPIIRGNMACQPGKVTRSLKKLPVPSLHYVKKSQSGPVKGWV